jgi:AcrR family transcriptional regulator
MKRKTTRALGPAAQPPVAPGKAAERPMRERILGAAFESFIENGYAGTSTLEIATRAKVSKRDLYANFDGKQAMLVACIAGRAQRMGLAPGLPSPRDRSILEAVLVTFGSNLVREVSHPTVLTMFRLAIGEAERSPEVAQTLHESGRKTSIKSLADFLGRAQAAGLLGPGEPLELGTQFVALLWDGLLVNLLLGVAEPPRPEEIEPRAARAAATFLKLHEPASPTHA